jgi:hypothetical protein
MSGTLQTASSAVVLGVLLGIFPCSALAQAAAGSFQELQRLVKAGEILLVVDRTGEESWGQVTETSEGSLTMALMQNAPDGRGTLVTSRRRTFTADEVASVTRSDLARGRGAAIYPASWERVASLPAGARVSVILDTGERRDFGFRSVGAEDLTLVGQTGSVERVLKSSVESVVLREYADPTGNGLGLGAAIGAGAALAMMAVMFARCDAGCEGPSPGPTYTAAAAFGAGIGAAVGWTADRLHKGSQVLFPIVSGGQRGIGGVVRF